MPHKLDRPLYLTEDRNEVVEEGDERARYVLGGEGSEIPDDEAKRLGLGGRQDKSLNPAAADKDTGPDATDAARELAEAEGVNLADIQGTGEGGRVLKSDVEGALSQRAAED